MRKPHGAFLIPVILVTALAVLSCDPPSTKTTAAEMPSIAPDGGSYAGSVTVTISCKTPGAQIRYTTDGNGPTEGSTLYAGGFALTESATVKAKAFATGYKGSEVASVVFTLYPTSSLSFSFTAPGDESITYDLTMDAVIDKSETAQFAVNVAEGFDSYVWLLDDGQVAGETDSTCVVATAALAPAVHGLTCLVTKNGFRYSKELVFRIVP